MLKYITAALIAALVAVIFYLNVQLHTVEQLKADNATLSTNLEAATKTAAVTEAVLSDLAESKQRIRTATKEITHEVQVRIPVDSYVLPPAWRVLHDAAATGRVPETTSDSDAAAVEAQVAATTVVENYGTCAENTDQLLKLQQWVRGVSK